MIELTKYNAQVQKVENVNVLNRMTFDVTLGASSLFTSANLDLSQYKRVSVSVYSLDSIAHTNFLFLTWMDHQITNINYTTTTLLSSGARYKGIGAFVDVLGTVGTFNLQNSDSVSHTYRVVLNLQK